MGRNRLAPYIEVQEMWDHQLETYVDEEKVFTVRCGDDEYGDIWIFPKPRKRPKDDDMLVRVDSWCRVPSIQEQLAEFEQVTIQRKPKYRVAQMVIYPFHTENDWECWLTRSPYADDEHDGYGAGLTMIVAITTALEAAKQKVAEPA